MEFADPLEIGDFVPQACCAVEDESTKSLIAIVSRDADGAEQLHTLAQRLVSKR